MRPLLLVLLPLILFPVFSCMPSGSGSFGKTSSGGCGKAFVHPWLKQEAEADRICARISPPEGYKRLQADENSFASWLRSLPLKPGNPQVHLFDGSLKFNQSAQFAVLDVDVGKRDLQQCADAVMRLRAEWLYSQQGVDALSFRFTSGDAAPYSKWIQGYRPVVKGNAVSWQLKAAPASGYENFRAWLEVIFNYCGSASLSKEMHSIPPQEMKPGDVFIRGGFPGHACIVMDVAENEKGEKIFLLAQSYMPAQEIHLLKNPSKTDSPWYRVQESGILSTPEYTFYFSELKRF